MHKNERENSIHGETIKKCSYKYNNDFHIQMLVSDQTITAPLTTHNVWVWLVSPVIWSQKPVSGSRVVTRRVGAIEGGNQTPGPSRDRYQTLFITWSLCKMSAEYQLLAGIIFSGTLRCYEESGGEIV